VEGVPRPKTRGSHTPVWCQLGHDLKIILLLLLLLFLYYFIKESILSSNMKTWSMRLGMQELEFSGVDWGT
jgi:hypothetical protein